MKKLLGAFLLGAMLFTTVPLWGQDLNTLLVSFISDLRSGTFSIGTGKDIAISSDGDGAVTFAAAGDGSDENLTINLDDTANTAVVSSSTGVTAIDFAAIGVKLGGTSVILEDADNFVALRNGTNSQVLRVYRTFTDASNYERYRFEPGASDITIGPETAGTGGDNLGVTFTPAGTGVITLDGPTDVDKLHFKPKQTATVDGATTFVATSNHVLLACTGAETINTITGGITGMLLVLENTDTDCTIADDDDAVAANAIDLTGAGTNDVGAVNKVITLIYAGAHWLQIAESDN